MKTILDGAKNLYLDSIRCRDGLQLIAAEGVVSDNKEDLQIGDVEFIGLRSIDVADKSRFFEIRFTQFVAWQVVNESFASIDNYEVSENKGPFCVLSRSRYLDHVNAKHGLYRDLVGPAKHYRLWTLDEVIDVVACEPPTIQLNERS